MVRVTDKGFHIFFPFGVLFKLGFATKNKEDINLARKREGFLTYSLLPLCIVLYVKQYSVEKYLILGIAFVILLGWIFASYILTRTAMKDAEKYNPLKHGKYKK